MSKSESMPSDAKIVEFLERLEELTRSTGVAIAMGPGVTFLADYDPETFEGYGAYDDGEFSTGCSWALAYMSPEARQCSKR